MAFSQNLRPIPQKVKNYQQSGKTFSKYELFSASASSNKKINYERAAKDITVLQLKQTELQKIVANQPAALEMTFPYEGSSITVQLIKNNIFAEGFSVNTSEGKLNYQSGVYYQGIVKGDEKSVVAFSFFNDDVVGIASQENTGNIVLGKVKNSEDFVSYNDAKLTKANSSICGFDELAENQKDNISFKPEMLNGSRATTNCVRVYYEICRAVYQQNNSNSTTTTNWITAVHNNIATLYSNDGISTAISQIVIWTTPDPYTGSYSQNLYAFRNIRTTFNGDLAHLINYPSTTSVAYLNSLCSSNRYAYSGIDNNYQNVPVYSWTIGAMTHEMGHSLGSPHTHGCYWNGNNTAIDGCGPAAGYGEGCNGVIPSNGGTIMSYCHLLSTGINFTKGFGDQPAALIRNTVDSKGCLGKDCITSCSMSVTNLSYSNLTANSVTITFTDNENSNWKYKVIKYDGTLVTSGTTSSKTINLTGLSEGTYYKVFIGTDCSGPNAYLSEILFLTDANWCSGVPFTDTGGESGYYGGNQEIIKTFYPSNPATQKLKMTFNQFDIEPVDGDTGEVYDYMTIYDGTSTSSPVFPGANQMTGNSIPGPFTATNAQGAITVKFFSDGGLELPGWKATFSCLILGTSENLLKENITVFPNPTKGQVKITSSDTILSCRIADISGKNIRQHSKLNTNNYTIDLSGNPKGVYMITIVTDKETITKKVIKE